MIDVFYDHFCAHGRLNGPKVKDETPFRYADAEIRTQVAVICGPTHYQLDHRGAPTKPMVSNSYDILNITGTNEDAFLSTRTLV